MGHLEAFLARLTADAAVIHRRENLRYLSGYSGEGCLFIAPGAKVIVTDFRYIEAAGREAPGWTVERTTSERKEADVLRALISGAGVKTVCVETDFLTYDDFVKLSEKLEGVKLAPLKGIPEALRQIKDPEEVACIREASRIAS